MPSRYFRADYMGQVFLRSSMSRVYVAATMTRHGLSWTSDLQYAGKGMEVRWWVQCREVSKPEYKQLTAEQRAARKALMPTPVKIQNVERKLVGAQFDQRFAGTKILIWNLLSLGYSIEEARQALGRGFFDTGERSWSAAQRDQANAFKRILKYRAALAKLEEEDGAS